MTTTEGVETSRAGGESEESLVNWDCKLNPVSLVGAMLMPYRDWK
jgi:hypothetical protein